MADHNAFDEGRDPLELSTEEGAKLQRKRILDNCAAMGFKNPDVQVANHGFTQRMRKTYYGATSNMGFSCSPEAIKAFDKNKGYEPR